MRERVQLIRVSHPHLGPYEADLVPVSQTRASARVELLPSDSPPAVHDHSGYVAHLFVQSNSAQPHVGERVVLRWDEGRRGRGVITLVQAESQEGNDTSWLTFKLQIELQEHDRDFRHYPRMIGGIELWYAPMEDVEESEAWLSGEARALTIDDDRFMRPLDALMNFSVSGLSFEAQAPLDLSRLLLCALKVGESDEDGHTRHNLIRCLSKVVRSAPEDDHFSIAISFVSPPPELTAALTDQTLKLQRLETDLPYSPDTGPEADFELDLDSLDIDDQQVEALTQEALALDLPELEPIGHVHDSQEDEPSS